MDVVALQPPSLFESKEGTDGGQPALLGYAGRVKKHLDITETGFVPN